MTHSELIKALSTRLDFPQVELKPLLEKSFEVMRDILDKGSNITIPGLGTFYTLLLKKRKSYNPYHKRFMMLPQKRVLRFHPGTSIKNEMKNRRF